MHHNTQDSDSATNAVDMIQYFNSKLSSVLLRNVINRWLASSVRRMLVNGIVYNKIYTYTRVCFWHLTTTSLSNCTLNQPAFKNIFILTLFCVTKHGAIGTLAFKGWLSHLVQWT